MKQVSRICCIKSTKRLRPSNLALLLPVPPYREYGDLDGDWTRVNSVVHGSVYDADSVVDLVTYSEPSSVWNSRMVSQKTQDYTAFKCVTCGLVHVAVPYYRDDLTDTRLILGKD